MQLAVANVPPQQQESLAVSQGALQDNPPNPGNVETEEPVLKTSEDGANLLTSIPQEAIQKDIPVDVDIGWLNLNLLLESPHRNSYLWAALTLLGILTLVAGLRILGRKTALTLSALPPTSYLSKAQVPSSPLQHLGLPADIAALSLELNPRSIQPSSEFQSPASSKTLQ